MKIGAIFYASYQYERKVSKDSQQNGDYDNNYDHEKRNLDIDRTNIAGIS